LGRAALWAKLGVGHAFRLQWPPSERTIPLLVILSGLAFQWKSGWAKIMDAILSFSSSAAYVELHEQAQCWIAHKTEDHRLAGLLGPQLAMQVFHVNEVELDLQNQTLLGSRVDLKASKTRGFQHFDLAPVGMLRLDPTGEVVECNRLAATMLGSSHERVSAAQQPFYIYLRDESRSVFKAHLQRLMDSPEMASCELVLSSESLGETPIRVQSVALCDEAGEVEVLVTLTDISELKRLEQERLKAARFEVLGVLAGGLGHELNNVLQVIASSLDLCLARVASDAALSGYLRDAAFAATRAGGISRRLLTFSKGGAPVTRTADLSEVLGPAVIGALNGSKIKPVFELAPLLAPVEIDTTQIRLAIECLVTNAREASESVDGTILIRARNVCCDGTEPAGVAAGEYVRLDVENAGSGISEGLRNKICDPCFTTKLGHAGIGLTTVVSILERHSGALLVASGVGKGAIFSIFLPVALTETPVPVLVPIRRGAERPRILVVDDEEMLSGLVQQMLLEMDCDCEVANEGIAGCRMFAQAQTEGRPFDVVLLDASIPGGVGGLDALRLLQVISPQVRAILFSGYSDDDLMINSKQVGFCARLQKPFRCNELADVLKIVLSEP
jgi:signal transduction histidine kinase/CheY-like chemotaxis protein